MRSDDSTSNLTRHIKGCTAPAAGAKAIENFMHGSTYSMGKLRYQCIKWVVMQHRPFEIMGDTELLKMLKMLYSNVETPHPRSIPRDISRVFEMAKENRKTQLAVSHFLYSWLSI